MLCFSFPNPESTIAQTCLLFSSCSLPYFLEGLPRATDKLENPAKIPAELLAVHTGRHMLKALRTHLLAKKL